MKRTEDEWEHIVARHEILWCHDGNMKRPHALLTSGKHSDGFFDAGRLFFDHPRLARELVSDFVETKVQPAFQGRLAIGCIIGPAFGAITFARDVADALDTKFCFTVPKGEGSEKTFALEKRFSIAGQVVLPVEDVITTAGSIRKTIEVAESAGAIVPEAILAICNRSGLQEVGGRQIIAMFDIPMKTWDGIADCPCCKEGSRAIRPKEKTPEDNWKKLTARYD